jgi:hypothetical protein
MLPWLAGRDRSRPAPLSFNDQFKNKNKNNTGGMMMFRTSILVFLAAVLLVAGNLHVASAQTATAPSDAKPSKMKLTMQKLKDMRAKWSANKPKLKVCRQEVKSKGLAGDDRWFYIEDCMNKT